MRSTGVPSLIAPISKRSCICYQVHAGVVNDATAENAQPFYLEDATGRALVEMDRYKLELGALVRQKQMAILSANINDVSRSISELKPKASHDSRVRSQLRELRELATLLCAVRAHARGNIHHGKTLEGQARYIEKQSHKYRQHSAARVVAAQFLGRFDTLLVDGQNARVTGEATLRRASGGYRDGARELVIVAPKGEQIHVSGEGAAAAATALEKHRGDHQWLSRSGPRSHGSLVWRVDRAGRRRGRRDLQPALTRTPLVARQVDATA